MRYLLAFAFYCSAGLGSLYAQSTPREVITKDQAWLGYMTSTRISERFSIWNDAHFVPDAFFVLRTGLSVHLPENLTLTGGYAYLGLPAEVTRDLKRPEHRPWAQAVLSKPLPASSQFLFRLRYDARFRRNLINRELQEGYTFNHRIRFLVNYRKSFPSLTFSGENTPFVAVSNEIHLNAGNQRQLSPLDQNRLSLMFGILAPDVQVQVGYMNRNVYLPSGNAVVTCHTAVLWITHRIDMRKKRSKAAATATVWQPHELVSL